MIKLNLKGTLEMLAQLGTNMNAVDKVGNTALHKAVTVCTSRSVGAVVSCLLSRGTKPSIRNREGDTALHLECRRVRTASLDVIDALLHAGADPNSCKKTGDAFAPSSARLERAPTGPIGNTPLTLILQRCAGQCVKGAPDKLSAIASQGGKSGCFR